LCFWKVVAGHAIAWTHESHLSLSSFSSQTGTTKTMGLSSTSWPLSGRPLLWLQCCFWLFALGKQREADRVQGLLSHDLEPDSLAAAHSKPNLRTTLYLHPPCTPCTPLYFPKTTLAPSLSFSPCHGHRWHAPNFIEHLSPSKRATRLPWLSLA
jgi:hypothetical protein